MPNTKPFFSIIIPTLNEARYLPHLLNDLAEQSFRDFEVIVVDGKSTDATLKQAKAFTSRLPSLRLLTSPKRHVCVQRNLGAKHAHGLIFLFMDADNRLPTYFLQGIKYRLEVTSADMIIPYIEPDIKTPQNEAITNAVNLFIEIQINLKPTYLQECMVIITQSAFHSIGGFDTTINYAEGKSFIKSAASNGFTIKVVKDPSYSMSFRRLRQYGVLSVAGRIAQMELSEFLGPDFHFSRAKKIYPMLGGATYTPPPRVKNRFLKNIAKLLKDF